MKAYTALLLIAVFCMITNVKANHSIDPGHHDWNVEFFAGIASKHIMPNGVKMYNHSLAMSELEIWHVPTGLYLETLARWGLDKSRSHGAENEFDVLIGINRKLFGQCRINLYGCYDHSIHMGSKVLDDFWRIGLTFGMDSKEARRHFSISPFVGVEAFISQKERSKHVEDGILWTIAGVNISTEIGKAKITYTPSLGWDDGLMKAKPGFVLTHLLMIDYQISNHWHFETTLNGVISRQSVGFIKAGFVFHW
jgi:hypothetical protein